MPLGAKFAIFAIVGALVAGAAFLMVERGPAILIDLAGAISACF